MKKTTKGTSVFSGALGLFQPKANKVKTRSARKSSAKVLTKKNGQSNQAGAASFRSAEIEFEDCACDAVKALGGKRLLLRDVPLIPVQDCDKPNCSCSYTRYSDRRLWTEDRRAFYSLKTSHYIQSDSKERRYVQDRRATQDFVAGASDSLEDFESWFNET
jgi:hypothetical protein